MSQNKNNVEDATAKLANLAITRDPIADLLEFTDTEESSSSSNTQIFDHKNPFVLELHELRRDELPDNPLPEVKTRRLLKKKKRNLLPANQSGSSLPSSSPSENSLVATAGSEETTKEEYYDAHESYHALPENQASAAIASAGIMQVFSEHGNEPKVQEPSPPAQDVTEPAPTSTEPVTPPE